jgi:hypothetical protein
MKLISVLLTETSNGIFSDKTYLDTDLDALQFEKGYERLARMLYPRLEIKKGHDPQLKMDVTLAYEVPSDLHFRYVESTGELFYDDMIFRKILNNPEVRQKLGKLWNISPDPVEVFRRYGDVISKVNV